MWFIPTFYLLLAVFCLPGFLLARGLTASVKNPFYLIAAGFVCSLAVFSVVAWPCLWYRWPAVSFWSILAPVWLTYLAVSIVLWRRGRSHATSASGTSGEWRGRRVVVEDPTTPSRKSVRIAAIALLAYFVWAGVIATQLAPLLGRDRPVPWLGLTTVLVWVLAGFLLMSFLPKASREDDAPLRDACPPRLWSAAAMIVIGIQVTGVALMARPEWDDAYYLSAIRQYRGGGALNREEPTLPHEGLAVHPVQRLLSWELLGATLCRFSGTHPLICYYTLMPPLLVVLAFAVHWELFTRLVGRRLAPLAIIGVSGYWLLANSAFESPGHYLLTRPWQGKAMLWHLGIPVVVISLWGFLERPAARSWFLCLLACTGALGMSSSGVFMLAVLLPTFCICLALCGRSGNTWRAIGPALACAGGIVPYGLAIRSALAGFPMLQSDHASWQAHAFRSYLSQGGAELLWIAALPLLLRKLPSPQGKAYLVALPCVMAVTAVNPFYHQWFAEHLTSHYNYFRLFWLLPVSVGTGSAIALLAESAADACFLAAAPARRAFVVLLAFLLAAGLALVPGSYAWSPQTRSTADARLTPGWGENLYKVPADLMPIVDEVRTNRALSKGRLLVPGHLSQFFLAFDLETRYVCSRTTYTQAALTAAKRTDEAGERVNLADRVVDDRFEKGAAQRLLDKYRVLAIVTGGVTDKSADHLRQHGFSLTLRRGAYQLWTRTEAALGE